MDKKNLNNSIRNPVSHTQSGAGPPNLPHGNGYNGTKGTSDSSYGMASSMPVAFGEPAMHRQMLDAYMRNDMLALCNNPYMFSRPYNFAEWMGMQQMYDNYIEFLNYIGESRAPWSHSRTIKMQSVQTQTPVHEFRSAMIQTDGADLHCLSTVETADYPEIGLKSSALGPDNVKKICACPAPELPQKRELKVLTDDEETGACSGSGTPVLAKGTTDQCQSKERAVDEETAGNKATFLDNNDLIMPVPRSRGRGRTPPNSNDTQHDSVPGHHAKNSHAAAHFEETLPGSHNEKPSTVPRSRGRGQPHNLKLVISSGPPSQNFNNNALDISSGTCNSLEARGNPGSPSLRTGVATSPTVSVPPGFEAKPVSPPTTFNLNIPPVSPIGLLPIGHNLNLAMGSPSYQQNLNTCPTDASETRKPAVSAPPGFSASSRSPINTWQKDLDLRDVAHYKQEKKVFNVAEKPNEHDLHKDKMKFPVFSKIYKAKKTSIQNYLRASLADSKKRRRMPRPTILEKIEEKNEEESLPDEDTELNSKFVEGKTEVKTGQEVNIKANDSQFNKTYTQTTAEYFVHKPSGNPYPKIRGPRKHETNFMEKSDSIRPQHMGSSPPKAFARQPNNLGKCSPMRNKVPQMPNDPFAKSDSFDSVKNLDRKQLTEGKISQETMRNTETWDDAETDVYVPCKWYNKQLFPIFKATGKGPHEINSNFG